MYNIIKSVIENRNFELSDMINKINAMWVQGKITEDNQTELIALARDYADVKNELHLINKVLELDKQVKEMMLEIKVLKENGSNSNIESGDEPIVEKYDEYVAGKWYYAGDKIYFNGENYECIAPNGQVCTWNPNEYPAYWTKF